MYRLLLLLVVLVVPSGCVVGPTIAPEDAAARFVRHGDMTYRVLELGAAREGPLVVVIEGDGAAWTRPDRPPRNPTPRDPVGLRVAERAAEAFAVLHIGRPCQFLPPSEARDCDRRWWTQDRYDAAVVGAFARTIEAARRGRRLVLVGHSGGGVIAAELALRLDGVERLVTFAAPIDLAAWTAFHGVSPLASPTGSALLDLLVASPVPQTHLFGARDAVVPDEITRPMRARLGPARAAVAEGMRHDDRWETLIASLLVDGRM